MNHRLLRVVLVTLIVIGLLGILKAGAETMLTEMSDKELLDLVSLNIDRAGM